MNNQTTINNIDCYGQAVIGANYEVNFDNESRDFIADDIEATSWQAVISQLQVFEGIQQIVSDIS